MEVIIKQAKTVQMMKTRLTLTAGSAGDDNTTQYTVHISQDTLYKNIYYKKITVTETC